MADPFDPDTFLASPGAGGGFDPDAFLGTKAPLSWSDVGSQALHNAPQSAMKFGEAIAQPFMHPIQTAQALGNINQGLVEYAGSFPGAKATLSAISPVLGAAASGDEHKQYVDAVAKFFADRYGGMENLKQTLATDPVGALADISAVFTGGETALARAPGMLGKVGEAAGTASRLTDPFSIAGKTAGLLTDVGSPERAALRGEGVQMTPGQLVGGHLKRWEDALSSVPILGEFMRSGRDRSVKSFNEAVGNQALEPIGESVARRSAGHEMVDEVATKLGNAYDNLLPQLKFIPDPQYWNDIRTIANRDVSILPEAQQKQFIEIMRQRHGPPAPMDGQMFKNIESELTNISRKYMSSPDAAQRGLGEAVSDVVTSMRDNLERMNPQHAEELSRINQGWAMYARIRQAASGATREGVFTPANLLSAIRSQDKSVGKGAFAKGDALMQTFAEAGQKVLPSKLADSGTPERALHIGALAAAHFIHPAALIGGAAAAVPYTGLGMRAINAMPWEHIPMRQLGQATFQAGRPYDTSPYGGSSPFSP